MSDAVCMIQCTTDRIAAGGCPGEISIDRDCKTIYSIFIKRSKIKSDIKVNFASVL